MQSTEFHPLILSGAPCRHSFVFPGYSEAESINTLAPRDLVSYSSTAADSSMLNKNVGSIAFILSASEHPGNCSLFIFEGEVIFLL